MEREALFPPCTLKTSMQSKSWKRKPTHLVLSSTPTSSMMNRILQYAQMLTILSQLTITRCKHKFSNAVKLRTQSIKLHRRWIATAHLTTKRLLQQKIMQFILNTSTLALTQKSIIIIRLYSICNKLRFCEAC